MFTGSNWDAEDDSVITEMLAGAEPYLESCQIMRWEKTKPDFKRVREAAVGDGYWEIVLGEKWRRKEVRAATRLESGRQRSQQLMWVTGNWREWPILNGDLHSCRGAKVDSRGEIYGWCERRPAVIVETVEGVGAGGGWKRRVTICGTGASGNQWMTLLTQEWKSLAGGRIWVGDHVLGIRRMAQTGGHRWWRRERLVSSSIGGGLWKQAVTSTWRWV